MDRSERDLKHYGVKGMKWGVHKEKARQVAGDASKARGGLKRNATKSAYAKAARDAGGLHKLSDKQLKDMLNRMENEKKFEKFMREDADRRREGAAALGRVMMEVGGVALPIVLGIAAKKYGMGKAAAGVYRTTASVVKNRKVIDGAASGVKAITSR